MQNPWSKWDPDGLSWRDWVSGALDFVPVVSTIKTAVELVAGQDLITGEEINRAESLAGLGASVIPGGKGALKTAKLAAKAADKAFEINGKADAVMAIAEDVANGDVSLDTLKNVASLSGGGKKNKDGGGAPQKDGGNDGGGGGNCFPAGTLVMTSNGAEAIEDIDEGETVMAYEFETGKLVSRTVTSTVEHFTYYWVDVDLGSETITATRGHRFWVESHKEWIEALYLQPGMIVREADGDMVPVRAVTVRELDTPEATFNFEVAEEHNYFVGDSRVLVHNGKPKEEKFERYGNKTEATEAARTNSLAPKPGHSGEKWIGEPGTVDPRKLGKPQNYTHKMEITAKPGTREWLKQFESKPTNEPGRYGVPAKQLPELNERIINVESKPRTKGC
jgi:hypothetical protein